MGKSIEFSAISADYTRLLKVMAIKPAWSDRIYKRAAYLLQFKKRYQEISKRTGVPWEMIATIHNLESGASFSKHLHNGDPLSAKTVRVPAGRPEYSFAPYTFEESAEDALLMKGLNKIKSWTDERICYEMERYNGFGHRLYHASVLTPYLWSGTNLYTSGKYVSDGKWDSNAVSQQVGGIPLLYAIREMDTVKKIDIVPVSEKMTVIHGTMKWIKGIGGLCAGVFTLDNFDFAKGFIDRIGETTPRWLLVLLLISAMYVVLKYLESKMFDDYKAGRWTPSGEAEDAVDDPGLAVERADNRDGREADLEAARAEVEPAVAPGGSREGADVAPEVVPA